MNEQVKDFISRRFNNEDNCHWADINSYWFAKILSLRFPSLKLCFNEDTKKFMCVNTHYKSYYDINGRHNLGNCNYVCIDKIMYDNPEYYMHLMQEYKD